MSTPLRFSRLLEACVNRDHLTKAALMRYPLHQRVRPRWRTADTGHDVYESLMRRREALPLAATHETVRTRTEVATLPPNHGARAIPELRQLIQHFETNELFDDCELILHGSLATADWCAYSDMDLVLVVRDTAFSTHDRLEQFCRRAYIGLRHVYAFDPLQHHGYLTISEAALSNYDRALFPPEILDIGYTLSGRPFDATFDVQADRTAAMEGLRWFESRMRRFAAANPPRTPYDVKAALSVLMLGPSLFFSAIGTPCFKRESFERIRAHLPAALIEPLDAATEARRAWNPPRCSSFRSIVRHTANPTFWSRLHTRLPLSTPLEAAPCLTPLMRQQAHEMAQALCAQATEHAVAI